MSTNHKTKTSSGKTLQWPQISSPPHRPANSPVRLPLPVTVPKPKSRATSLGMTIARDDHVRPSVQAAISRFHRWTRISTRRCWMPTQTKRTGTMGRARTTIDTPPPGSSRADPGLASRLLGHKRMAQKGMEVRARVPRASWASFRKQSLSSAASGSGNIHLFKRPPRGHEHVDPDPRTARAYLFFHLLSHLFFPSSKPARRRCCFVLPVHRVCKHKPDLLFLPSFLFV